MKRKRINSVSKDGGPSLPPRRTKRVKADSAETEWPTTKPADVNLRGNISKMLKAIAGDRRQQAKQRKTYQQICNNLDLTSTQGPNQRFVEHILLALADCASLVHPEAHKDLLRLLWGSFDWDLSPLCTAAYERVLLNLSSANQCHRTKALQSVMRRLGYLSRQQPEDEDDDEGAMRVQRQAGYRKIHQILRYIRASNVEMSRELLPSLIKNFPNKWSLPETYVEFTQQVFKILEYCPELRDSSLRKILEGLVELDMDNRVQEFYESTLGEGTVIALGGDTDDKEDQEHEAADSEGGNVSEQTDSDDEGEEVDIIKTLDAVLELLLKHLSQYKQAPAAEQKDMFNCLLRIFEHCILKSHKLRNIQFIMLYFCSFSTQFAETFLNRLLNKLYAHRPTHHERRCCAAFAGAFVARARYVKHFTVQRAFDRLLDFAHAYAEVHDTHNEHNVTFERSQDHYVFYDVVQAAFYVAVYRARILDKPESRAKYGKKIEDLLVSRLTPFQYCIPELCQEVAALLTRLEMLDMNEAQLKRLLQRGEESQESQTLRESESEAEWSKRQMSASIHQFFPFDVFVLPLSKSYVEPLWRDHESAGDTERRGTSLTAEVTKPMLSRTPTREALTPCRGSLDSPMLSGQYHFDSADLSAMGSPPNPPPMSLE